MQQMPGRHAYVDGVLAETARTPVRPSRPSRRPSRPSRRPSHPSHRPRLRRRPSDSIPLDCRTRYGLHRLGLIGHDPQNGSPRRGRIDRLQHARRDGGEDRAVVAVVSRDHEPPTVLGCRRIRRRIFLELTAIP